MQSFLRQHDEPFMYESFKFGKAVIQSALSSVELAKFHIKSKVNVIQLIFCIAWARLIEVSKTIPAAFNNRDAVNL